MRTECEICGANPATNNSVMLHRISLNIPDPVFWIGVGVLIVVGIRALINWLYPPN